MDPQCVEVPGRRRDTGCLPTKSIRNGSSNATFFSSGGEAKKVSRAKSSRAKRGNIAKFFGTKPFANGKKIFFSKNLYFQEFFLAPSIKQEAP
jgi:hypothetical protein